MKPMHTVDAYAFFLVGALRAGLRITIS